MDYQFCPICGGKLERDQHTGYPRCGTGHYTFLPWQNVGVAAVVFKDNAVLLEQRAFGSAYGFWALPGGMLEFNEQTDEACVREILEETGIQVEIRELLGVIGGRKVCIIFYEAKPVGGNLAKSEESLNVKWFSFDNIPWDQMAFLRHTQVLREWVLNHS
ncbi:MAG: NUDIX hydrolase [Bacilli bacterium]